MDLGHFDLPFLIFIFSGQPFDCIVYASQEVLKDITLASPATILMFMIGQVCLNSLVNIAGI